MNTFPSVAPLSPGARLAAAVTSLTAAAPSIQGVTAFLQSKQTVSLNGYRYWT